ncbi:MAG: hypothetical protein OQK24_01910 [Magnetovibrio sp.]|nr:hypothetical protein [Magnetovibrio sp.]
MASSRKPGRKITFDDAVQIWLKLFDGAFSHTIAAEFETNQGRISEVRTGKRQPGSREAALEIIKEEEPDRYSQMIENPVFKNAPEPGRQYFFPFKDKK